jgi:hypothetical protein
MKARPLRFQHGTARSTIGQPFAHHTTGKVAVMKSLTGARRPALSRKILLIAAAAIGIALACVKAAFPGCCVIVFGMMPPDMIVQRTNHGVPVEYRRITNRDGSETLKRNGVNLITVKYDAKSGMYSISDPNGSGEAVYNLPSRSVKAGGSASTR